MADQRLQETTGTAFSGTVHVGTVCPVCLGFGRLAESKRCPDCVGGMLAHGQEGDQK